MRDVEGQMPDTGSVFAAAALQGMLPGAGHNLDYYRFHTGDETRQAIAETAAKFADYLLAELVKREA